MSKVRFSENRSTEYEYEYDGEHSEAKRTKVGKADDDGFYDSKDSTGAGVKITAAEIFNSQGAEIFRKIAKLHFKTWNEISQVQ